MRKKRYNGFTFIELIVVVSIFSVVVAALTGLYLRFLESENYLIAFQKVHSDGQVALETMVREIRLGTIDYVQYATPLSNPQNTLHLIDPDNNVVRFSRVNAGCPIGVNNCLEVSVNGQKSVISGQGVEIDYLNFYISPIENPFTLIEGNYGANQQPRVTILLGLSSNETSKDIAVIELQASASSKRYLR